jgi:heat shock protein HslJ
MGRTSTGGRVTIGNLAFTRRACPDPVMRAEDEYLRALASVDTIEVMKDRLVLRNDHGVPLEFHPVDVRAGLTGRWNITGVNNGNAIASPVPGTDPMLTFRDNGDLQVQTGCNTGHGTWEVRGETLSVRSMASTNKACIGPDGITEQEDAIFRQLRRQTVVQVSPDQLVLLHPRGTIALTASR